MLSTTNGSTTIAFSLSLDDANFIANALRTAAEVYQNHADERAKHSTIAPIAPGLLRVFEQFQRQATHALDLAARIEDY